MADALDYLKWRGDLRIENDPLNDIDCLIFSWLSYVDLQGIVPSDCTRSITIRRAAETFLKYNDLEKILVESNSFTKTSGLLLKKCAESARFSDMTMFFHKNEVVPKIDSQFSALTIKVAPKTYVVAYRGTDDNLVGWKEDFNMSFMSEVPAQKKALNYLEEVATKVKGDIYICGHSKGGNLAVFAACRANKRVRDRIKKVYDFDGPGFMDETILGPDREDMYKRTMWVTPDESLVGALMNDLRRFHVVKSSAKGVMQHDAGTWQVMGTHFDTVDEVKAISKVFDETMKNWLKQLSDDEKSAFTDAVFKILSANSATSTLDISADLFKSAAGMFKEFKNLSQESRDVLKKCSDALIKESMAIIKKREKKQLLLDRPNVKH